MGRQALAVPTNIGDAQQVTEPMEKAIETSGRVDALINNAGICLTDPMVDTILEE